MKPAGALCLFNSIPPPRACPSARHHAATTRRGEQGPTLFTQRGGRGWRRSNRRLVTWNTLTADSPSVESFNIPHEKLEQIKAFKVPEFTYRHPWRRNQFADNAKAEANRWLAEYAPLDNVYESPEKLRSFYKSDLSEWAVLSFIECGEKELAFPAKLTLLTFILDDYIDDFNSPEAAMSTFFLELMVMTLWSFPNDEQLYKSFVDFLDEGHVADRDQTLKFVHSNLVEARRKPGTIYDTSSPEVHWICKAWGDLWAELYESMPHDFLRRWAYLWQTYLLENVREIMNRKNKKLPTVDEIIYARGHTTGFWIFTKLYEYTEKIVVPHEIYDSPEMQRLLNACCDALAFDNDLWSFQKEVMIGDVHNMVIVLSRVQDCSFEEAGRRTHGMMMKSLADMEAAIADLEKKTPPEYQEELSLYVRGLRHMYAGTRHWYEDTTSRYRDILQLV